MPLPMLGSRRVRWACLAVAVAAFGCGDESKDREKRDVPLVLHDGYQHRLVVKFSDDAGARIGSGGKVDAVDGELDAALAKTAAEHGMRFDQLIGLRDAKLDSVTALGQSDLAAIMMVDLPTDEPTALMDAALALKGLDAVEYVYFEPIAVPPPGDIEPVTDSYVASQTYRGTAGIDADHAASVGVTGAGVRLFDCEYGWNLAHEDLSEIGATIEPGQTVVPQVAANGWDDHGTAVIGMTSATPNAYGVTGMVPDAELHLYPEWTVEGGSRRATAIANAIAAAQPGDVILLEMQTVGPGGGYAPAELDPAIWTLVKNATDAGIVVVAAAGNGNQNLDSAAYDEYRSRGDSGAILVGAGSATVRQKLGFSTYGARVDVHGWGESVTTTGYGDLAVVGGDPNQEYTAAFSGTSSASPMVASAAVALQSYAKANLGGPLSPADLRQLLIDTGTPQIEGDTGEIGPMPNLHAALDELAAGPGVDAGPAPDAGGLPDAGPAPDAGPVADGGTAPDAGGEPDAGSDPTASCEGHCDSSSPVPGSFPACYCDENCTRYGDCCGDYEAVCTQQ